MSLPIIAMSDPDERVRRLIRRYHEQFGEAADLPFFLVSVPLRVCPLGAHSDHQGGIVTGLTIDGSIQLLGRPTESAKVSVFSDQFSAVRSIEYAAVPEKVSGDWGNYLYGAVEALGRAKGALSHGFQGVLHGAMPIGGLSSSAAVTIAYLKALEHVNGLSSSPLETIMLVRAVENGYLGLHNGILDQSVIVSGKKDSLVCIDCASLSITTASVSSAAEPWEILVIYSGLSRQLTATPFNQRVAECHEAARSMLRLAGKTVPEKPLLGEVDEELFEQYQGELSDPLRRRALHFYSERARVRRGIELWSKGDISGFGKLITASGESSIVNYEAGSEALISLYEILSHVSGVYGTRFCGGGFQGCCLALIDPRKREHIAQAVHDAYTSRHPELTHEYSIHFCQSAESVSLKVVP